MISGEKIKQRRKELMMTQTELAKKLNTTKQTIGKYEHGIVTNLPMNRIEELAEALMIEPEFLAGWKEDNPADTSTGLSDIEQNLIGDFRMLSQKTQDNVSQTVSLLSTLPQDQQETVSSLVLAIRKTK